MSHTQPAVLDAVLPALTAAISVRPVVLPAPDRRGSTGDQDQSPLSVRGPGWWADAYTLSPAEKSLLTLFGSEPTVGGIAGYSVHETTDWSVERIMLIQQVTTAYLRSALNLENEAWSQVRAALADDSHPLGGLESK